MQVEIFVKTCSMKHRDSEQFFAKLKEIFNETGNNILQGD